MQASCDFFGKRPPCIIGGDASPIADHLLAANPGYVIAPAETDQTTFLADAVHYPDTHVRVHIPTAPLALGDRKTIRAELESLRPLVAGRTNISIGCGVVPYETDPSTLDFIGEEVITWP